MTEKATIGYRAEDFRGGRAGCPKWWGVLITCTRDSALEDGKDQKCRERLVGIRVTPVTSDSLSLGESRTLARESSLVSEV